MIYSNNGQHNTLHFHVNHTKYEACIGISSELLADSFSVKQLRVVQACVVIHEEQLYAVYNKMINNKAFSKIEPLR